jgi:hypothetical protein
MSLHTLLAMFVSAYLSFFVSLLVHEMAHSAVAWKKGAASALISVSFLPHLYLPMSPKLDESKYEVLPSGDKVKILLAGLTANLLVWGLAALVLRFFGSSLPALLYSFILFLALANLAEVASYATVGAVRPVSDIKFLLAEFPRLPAAAIYVPSTLLCVCFVYLTSRLFPAQAEVAYWAFFITVYVLLGGSRIVLTSDWKRR